VANTITVKAGPTIEAGRVALWDRDPAHADGEVFLAKAHAGQDDEPIEVAETPGVIIALGEGRLVRAERRRATAPTPVSSQPTASTGETNQSNTAGDVIAGVTDGQRDALVAAGFVTALDIRNATDDQLLAVDGIGPSTVARLREAVKE
jgi:hypothetical protein